MLLTILSLVSILLVDVLQEDIDASLTARSKGPEAEVASFCESDGTPLAFALHRLGYALNAQDDDWILLARTWDDEPVKYHLTWPSLDRTRRVCVDQERIRPFTAVLVAGEYTPYDHSYRDQATAELLSRVP